MDEDYILDISGLSGANPGPETTPEADSQPTSGLQSGLQRPFLSIYFRCCHVYHRVYRNRQGTAYQGNCPKCARPLRVGIGAGGSRQRFFMAE